MNFFVDKLVREIGKSEDEIKVYWENAKAEHSLKCGRKEEEFSKDDYDECVYLVKSKFTVDEKFQNPSEFIHSDMSASEFLGLNKQEDTMVSANVPEITQKENPIEYDKESDDINDDINNDKEDEENPVSDNWEID